MPLRVFDPHVHLWDVRRTPRKVRPLAVALGWWPAAYDRAVRLLTPPAARAFYGTLPHVTHDYLPADYRTAVRDERFELVGCAHVEAEWQAPGPIGPVGETEWLESLDMPELRAIVGHADLSLGDGVREVLEAHCAASDRFRGIRHMLSHSSDPGVLDFAARAELSREPAWRRGYAQLGALGLSFDAWCLHEQLDEVAELAEGFPDIPVILCHTGSPLGGGGPFASSGHSAEDRAAVRKSWEAKLTRLARCPQVSVKLSGLSMPLVGLGLHGVGATVEELAEAYRPWVRFAIEAFGAERCMFASNFPVDRGAGSWVAQFAAFERIVEDATDEERAGLFCGNAMRVYRVEGRASLPV